jgi:hypothetical protein
MHFEKLYGRLETFHGAWTFSYEECVILLKFFSHLNFDIGPDPDDIQIKQSRDPDPYSAEYLDSDPDSVNSKNRLKLIHIRISLKYKTISLVLMQIC